MTMTPVELKSALEAIIYAADEPATVEQMASAVGEEKHLVRAALDELVGSYGSDERGIEIRAVAGGYRVYTKPQHHDVVRRFIKSLRPPLAPDHAGAGDARGDRLQAARDAAGDSGDSRRELRRRDPDAARKAPDHHRRAQTGDRSAHPVPHLEGVHDALWPERPRGTAQPQGVRGAGARSAGHRRRSSTERSSRRVAEPAEAESTDVAAAPEGAAHGAESASAEPAPADLASRPKRTANEAVAKPSQKAAGSGTS